MLPKHVKNIGIDWNGKSIHKETYFLILREERMCGFPATMQNS